MGKIFPGLHGRSGGSSASFLHIPLSPVILLWTLVFFEKTQVNQAFTPLALVPETPESFDNASALTALLASIEASSLSARDKGTRFETLIRDWLMKEPTYANLFTKVQTWT